VKVKIVCKISNIKIAFTKNRSVLLEGLRNKTLVVIRVICIS
jgi:hypothetical protein